MDPKVVYVIAAWSGDRRHMHPRYKKDRTYFLKNHLDRLSSLKHSLSKIVIVWPFKKKEHDSFICFLSECFETYPSLPIFILLHHNKALSYGSWLHAFETFGDQFTHYIFMEDDYLPSIDYFDTEMLNLLSQNKEYGAVFACTYSVGKYEYLSGKYASISNGMFNTWALRKAHDEFKKVCYPTTLKGRYSSTYQLGWGKAMCDLGIRFIDVGSKFKIKYHEYGRYVFYPPNENIVLMEAM